MRLLRKKLKIDDQSHLHNVLREQIDLLMQVKKIFVKLMNIDKLISEFVSQFRRLFKVMFYNPKCRKWLWDNSESLINLSLKSILVPNNLVAGFSFVVVYYLETISCSRFTK